MKTKKLFITVAFGIFLTSSTSPAHAFLGMGDVVFDPAAFINALTSIYNLVQGLRQGDALQDTQTAMKKTQESMEDTQAKMAEMMEKNTEETVEPEAAETGEAITEVSKSVDESLADFETLKNAENNFAINTMELPKKVADQAGENLEKIKKELDEYTTELNKALADCNAVTGTNNHELCNTVIAAIQAKIAVTFARYDVAKDAQKLIDKKIEDLQTASANDATINNLGTAADMPTTSGTSTWKL